jgi:serine phosphatase RsbU (regulator of sigma subunit)
VTARHERIGVLEVSLDGPVTEHVGRVAEALGLLLGYLITAADHWTDAFHVARRRKDMTLAAEIQWNLLPLAAFATPRISLAGALEPAYEVGGDAFDYTCGATHLVVGIFDAMGHGLAASRASALAVAAFRNARRCGKDLAEQARFVDRTVDELEGWDGYVTAQMLSIDLEEPLRSTIVNAGHPRPYLQRGREPPHSLAFAAHQPMGIGLPGELAVEKLPLMAGDRLTLLSDGTFEARPDGGEAFGEERLASQLEKYRDLSARETARLLISSIRQHRAADLADDATLVIIDLPTAKGE